MCTSFFSFFYLIYTLQFVIYTFTICPAGHLVRVVEHFTLRKSRILAEKLGIPYVSLGSALPSPRNLTQRKYRGIAEKLQIFYVSSGIGSPSPGNLKI